jgi:chromosome segregation ATPase
MTPRAVGSVPPDQWTDYERRLIDTQYQLGQHSAHLAAINGSIARAEAHMERVDEHMTAAQTDVAVLKDGVFNLAKDITSIVASLDSRDKEAHADRKSVKLAIYSFAGAIAASGIGALIVAHPWT